MPQFQFRCSLAVPGAVKELVKLTTVSRQLHAETRLLPFQLNEFRFEYDQTLLNMIIRHFTPQQLASIRAVRVEICHVTCARLRETSMHDMPLETMKNLRTITVELGYNEKKENVSAACAAKIEALFREHVDERVQIKSVGSSLRTHEAIYEAFILPYGCPPSQWITEEKRRERRNAIVPCSPARRERLLSKIADRM